MPLYEYRCEACEHPFEALIRHHEDVPRCPSCGGVELTRQFSVPAAAQTGGSRSSLPIHAGAPAAGCGAPQCGQGMCGLGG
ncbi:hypothetical protein BH23PLA1_BH23PLA1_10570 [soil metagenome]